MSKLPKTGVEELQKHVAACSKEYEHWKALRTDGGTDPNWSDGVNLNLVRTHIICAKKEIRRTCDKFGLTIPAIYYRPLPPEMPADFFVTNGKNSDPQRIARIMNLRGDDELKPVQLSLF